MYMYSIMGTKNSKATILFCIVCVISAVVVMIIFNIARKQKSPTSSSMSREDEGSGTVGCPYWQVAGDQFCDDEANIAECNFDDGDCCDYMNDFSLCQECVCRSEYFANRTRVQSCVEDTTIVGQLTAFLGDGKCQLQLNNVENFFDAGDCCLENPECQTVEEVKNWQGGPRWNRTDMYCPQNICIRTDSYCIEALMGDGICDDINNSNLCDFDGGDCCGPKKIKDFCCICACLPVVFYIPE